MKAGSIVIHDNTPARHDSNLVLNMMIGGYLAAYKPITRECYALGIRKFRTYIEDRGISMLDAQRGHIEAWCRHMDEELQLKPKTVACYLTAVKGVYKNAARDGYLLHDPAQYVRKPRVQFRSTTNCLNRTQAADFARAAEKDSPMAHLLISLLMNHGLRITECTQIDFAHLGFDRGYTTLHLPYRKGGKVATIPLAPSTVWAIETARAGRTTGPLLLGRTGLRMSPAGANRIVHRLAAKIGVTKRITCHSMRRVFVTMARDAGVSDRDLTAATGHSDPSMLAYYDDNAGMLEASAGLRVAAYIGAAA